MLDDCSYDKIKILHELSCISWFLEKHGLQDTKNSDDENTRKIFTELKKDLDKYIQNLSQNLK